MMTTDLPAIDTLDADALRRELAERLGWHLEHRHYPETLLGMDVEIRPPNWIGIRPDGSEFTVQANDKYAEAVFYEAVPDWTDDESGAALALCLEIADRHNWRVVLFPDSRANLYDAEFTMLFRNTPKHQIIGADTPALALARLALSALRAGA